MEMVKTCLLLNLKSGVLFISLSLLLDLLLGRVASSFTNGSGLSIGFPLMVANSHIFLLQQK